MKKFLILYNLRSVYNVGAIFRTADAVGIDCVYLIGTTPTPLDRFGSPRSDFAKCALGSEKTLAWEYRKTLVPLIKKLQKEGVQIIALEQDAQAIDYKKYEPIGDCAVICGEEVYGIPLKIRALADQTLEIPMKGTKESLNVSVATGILLYGLFDRD
jgi:tRNA G18 (ribose-2'-O)-methylase SpoU